MNSLDGKATYLSSESSICGGRNGIQMWEGNIGSFNVNLSCFVPNGEGSFTIDDSTPSCASMVISGPWPFPLVSGVETTNGNIAEPVVNITHIGNNKVEGTISGTIAESNQDGSFTERTISGSFKLRKL